jgi:N-acetylglucosamine-6-phosphate deacetylase
MNITGKLCETGQLAQLTIENDQITQIQSTDNNAKSTFGGADVWIAPGFIDAQFNGYGGYDFNLGIWDTGFDQDQAAANILQLAAKTGTARLCPTVVTNTEENIVKAFRRLVKQLDADPILQTAMSCFHLEGPYLSEKDGLRGAHPADCIRDPDWDQFQRFQEAADGHIKILTVAPERDGSIPFIEKAAANGIVISLGHTGATPEQVRDAVKAGARMSTHLGNGSHDQIQRHRNYIFAQLADDGLTAGIIADGDHLPPELVRIFARVKGAEKLVLVSDAAALGGLPPGVYGGTHEVLPGGKIALAGTPYLAGAGHLLDVCVANALRWTELGMAGIAQSVANNPAQLLDLKNTGSVKVGNLADLTLFRESKEGKPLEIIATMLEGKVLFQA